MLSYKSCLLQYSPQKGRRKNSGDETSYLDSLGRIPTSRNGEKYRFGHFLHSWGGGRDHTRQKIWSWRQRTSRRIRWWGSQSYGENPSEAAPEHLGIYLGQLTEYRRGRLQVYNQNLLLELLEDRGELEEGVELSPAQLDKLKGRI